MRFALPQDAGRRDDIASMASVSYTHLDVYKRQAVVPPMPAPVNHIEIELAGGHRMRISGSYDPEVLARLIRGLTCLLYTSRCV